MNKHIQIRNVSPELHRSLKIRATEQGLSLSDYLRIEMERLAKLPTAKEWVAMVKTRASISLSAEDTVRLIHEGREERAEGLLLATGNT